MTRKRKSVSSEDAGDKPVYLVVEHQVEEPSHSIVIAGATVPLRHAKRGMSFAAVDSRWIVGVGGDHSSYFTIYDVATSREKGGPWLHSRKVNPILVPHRNRLYILSSRPKLDRGADFLPWFEVLTLRDGNLPSPGGCSSCKLPPPPIFPYCINPLEYLNPPDMRVAAYAVVGSHILLSVSFKQHQQEGEEEKGTCAFDMDRQVWDMVDHTRSLPFVGEAVSLGNHIFIARSKERQGAAGLYYIAVFPPKDTSTGKSELSILELPLDVPKGRVVPGQHLCALGMGRFSSFDVQYDNDDPDIFLAKARIIQRTYSLVKGEDTTSNLEVVKRQRQVFKLLDRSHFLARPAPVVAAITMGSK